MKTYFVYVITNYTKTTLYIGVTSDLVQRIDQHKKGVVDGFSMKYNLKYLVYFEKTGDVSEAILREKQLKKWKREWKERLINELNPKWRDLSDDWV